MKARMTDSRTSIERAHALDGTARAIEAHYRDWASTYDRDVLGERYDAPEFMCELFVELSAQWPRGARERASLLDAGCGTGLIGAALARHGRYALDGFDLSEEMVERARGTGA
ncbi:hypothetical protein GCM10027091_65720 [Streptomyces daliensis]